MFLAFFGWFLKIGLNEIRETFYRLSARYLKWNSLFLYYLLIRFHHNRKGGPFEIEQPKVGPKGEPSGCERVKEHKG